MVSFPWVEQMPVLARQAAEILSRQDNVEEVWLFGSVGKLQWNQDSDLDLMIILRDSSLSRYQRSLEAYRQLDEVEAPKDVVVLTREEWEMEGRAPSSLVNTVKREGVRLYERRK